MVLTTRTNLVNYLEKENMSVKAKLLIDGKEINVLWFHYAFKKGADITGRPSQKTVFIGIKLLIETRKDLNLADWAFAANKTKQLELHIYPVILGGRTRKILFYDCHLINWINDFSATGNQPMSETLEITAAGVQDSNSMAEYSSYWRKTFPQEEVTPTVIEKEAPNVIDYYLTDLEENKIKNYKVGDKITLNIETENLIGAAINVNLNDRKYDFKHNGITLENDILKNYVINNTLEKVELEVIAAKKEEFEY